MEFFIAIGLIVLGFAILVFGGEALVRAAISMATKLKISPAIIGLTIIAAGTSAPELVTSIVASLKGAPDIAIGNIIGSNMFNLLAILGLASLIRSNKIPPSIAKFELPLLLLCTILFISFCWDLKLQQLEGLLCL